MEKEQLVIMVKDPARTQVKTRLARALGSGIAVDLYRAFVADILSTVRGTGLPCTVAFTPRGSRESVLNWLGSGIPLMEQAGDDLGARMKDIFVRLFREGRERIVLIGSDIPDLTGDLTKEAFSRVREEDAVIGPAQDGGYYLVGFTREGFLPDIFEGIEWGTERVFDETAETFRRKGRTPAVLPQWSDVDTLSDLQALFRRHENSAFRSSRTMACIVAHGALIFP